MEGVYYECGICGHYHPWNFNGDCRDDASRFTADALDAKHGFDEWEAKAMFEKVADDIGEMSATALMDEFRINCGDDNWGTTLAWWFAVAGEMWERALPVPDSWQYRPSPFGGRDPDAYETAYCAAATDCALRLFGRALTRYAAKLKAAGLDY